MTAHRQYRYRDPLEVLISEESRTCKGCYFKTKVWGVDYCEHPDRAGGKATRRCAKYIDQGDEMLRRVKKEEVQRDTWIKPDALDYCLDCWRVWMAGDADKDLDAKTMRLSMASHLDPDEQEQARNNQIGAATDAMIDSLSMLNRWAIYVTCGLATPWKFPNADILRVGPVAREALAEKLKKNCCTGVLF